MEKQGEIMKKPINWALAGTGGITRRFAVGLRAAEGAKLAAAVSRSRENAEKLAADFGMEKAYGDYDAMLGDSSIDAVYIGTPHTTHKELTIRALKAKKAVLCEKPFCINAQDLREMIKTARENDTFLMEAMWNRFVPPLVKTRAWLADGLIGEVRMIDAKFGFSSPRGIESRLFNLELGGGALLDAGVYPISLASMVFGGGRPEKISSLLYFGESGADYEFTGIMSYGGPRMAMVSAALCTPMVNDGWIYGAQGKIHLPGFVFSHAAELLIDGRPPYHYEPDFISNGYNYEAEAVMDCLREGKTECPVMPLDESLAIMETMDGIRAQWNFTYPGE
jgi:predicted dehydrogenase